MKALQSPLAKKLLADPEFREQLRRQRPELAARGATQILVERQGQVQRYRVSIVPKAG